MKTINEPPSIFSAEAQSLLTFNMKRGSCVIRILYLNHLAKRSFFEVVQKFSEYQNGLVLLEGTQGMDLENGNEREKKMHLIRLYMQKRSEFARLLGYDLHYQSDVLQYDTIRSVRADISLEADLSCELQPAENEVMEYTRLIDRLQLDIHNAEKGIFEDGKKEAIEKFWLEELQVTLLTNNQKLNKCPNRDECLLRNVHKYRDEARLIIPWGANHMHTIVPALLEDKWEVEPKTMEYIPFIKKPVIA